jgi:hypothetical protein
MVSMVLGLGILWDLAARRETHTAVTGVYTLLWLATGLVAPIGVYMLAGKFVPTAGFIFLAAILASLVAREVTRDGRTLLGDAAKDPSPDPAATSFEQAKGYLRLSVMLLMALAVVGVATAVTMDAPKDPWSCVAFSLLAFGYWIIQGVRRKLETPAAIAAAVGLSVGPLGLLVYTEGSLATLAGLVVGGWILRRCLHGHEARPLAGDRDDLPRRLRGPDPVGTAGHREQHRAPRGTRARGRALHARIPASSRKEDPSARWASNSPSSSGSSIRCSWRWESSPR